MSYCTIITKRILKHNHLHYSDGYIRELHKNVATFSGFRSGESYWTDTFNVVTISKWDSDRDFKNWLYSDIRNDIERNYADNLLEENHEYLYKITENTGTFLL